MTISKPFYMGIYELTQAQWKAVMGTEPWMTKTALGYASAQPRPQGDPYKGENIFIHEFAHGIHSVLGEEFNVRLRELYDKAKQSGRFGGYAIDGGVAEF